MGKGRYRCGGVDFGARRGFGRGCVLVAGRRGVVCAKGFRRYGAFGEGLGGFEILFALCV